MMPIKRRKETQPAVTEISTQDIEAEIAVAEIDTELARVSGYVAGNEGRQPHPRDVPVDRLLANIRYCENPPNTRAGRIEGFYRNRVRSPLTAIRGFCVLCNDGAKAATDCETTNCPLWPFRTGKNGFFGRIRDDNEEESE